MRKLTTEADGRALAIKMLREGERLSVDATCLYPTGDDIRGGRPQKNFALRYLRRLRKADSEEVYRGFAAVLSDVCGTIAEGVPDVDYYEREEQEAALRPDVLASLIQEPGHA